MKKKRTCDPNRVDKHQIRFWTTEKQYEEFKVACDAHDLVYQTVFESLMRSFIVASRNGTLKIVDENFPETKK